MAETPKDAQDVFNNKVPAALAQHPDKARELNAVYQFKISGDGGGDWTVDLVSSPPTCTPGLTGTANCTVEVGHGDFLTLIANPAVNGMQLYFQGKLKVTGDPMLATKLQKLFALA